jgi:thiamine biosynthesis lipoprotein
VIADDCMTADAYATAFMAMGMERSIEVAKELPGVYYYFIYEKNDSTFGIEYSNGFEQFFTH